MLLCIFVSISQGVFLFFFFCDTLSLDVCVFTGVLFYFLKYLGFIEHFSKLLPFCLSHYFYYLYLGRNIF